MADIVSGLAQLALPRIGTVKSAPDGLRSWLSVGTYRVDGNDGKAIKLSDISLGEIIPYLSYDYERFALSSLESLKVSLSELVSSGCMSWPIIKLYYSAFFAAHALMRLCGVSIVKLDKEQVAVIQAVSDAYVAGGGQIVSGMYQVRFFQGNGSSINALIELQNDNQGAHEGFWRAFDAFLDRVATEMVARKMSGAGSFLADIGQIQPMLRPYKARRSAWISAMRNEINYQHRHGFWSPNRLKRKARDQLGGVTIKSSSSVRLDFKLDKNEAEAFIAISHFLASVNVDVGTIVAANSKASQAFGHNWRRLR